MYFGHTWSPVLELAVSPPLLHCHAISVDIYFSLALANYLGLLREDQYDRFLGVFSRLGLAMDGLAFKLELINRGTEYIIATSDDRLRAPVPRDNFGTLKILQLVDEMGLERKDRTARGIR